MTTTVSSSAHRATERAAPAASAPVPVEGSETGPVFVVGPDRSGTTLMQAILGSHPHIAMPPKASNMWTYFYDRYGDLGVSRNFERCLADILAYPHAAVLEPDADQIRAEFRLGPATYARLFAVIHAQYARRLGKPRWGDRSTYVERHANEILAAFPTGRMIHMIRDPRDRYASSITRWSRGAGRVGGATARWLYSTRLARRNEARYPDRYRIVRYEDLVVDPEGVMQAVCRFLGEAFDPVMLSLEGAETFRGRGGNSSYGRHGEAHISPRSVGRFRSVLSDREVAFMQAHAGREMRRMGYPPSPVRLSIRDRLRLAIWERPLNLVRMAVWRVLVGMSAAGPKALSRRASGRGPR